MTTTMKPVKLHGEHETGLAAEMNQIMHDDDRHCFVSGGVLTVDAADAEEWVALARDAAKYNRSVGKLALAKAAERLGEKFSWLAE